jgi:hypothetical protein
MSRGVGTCLLLAVVAVLPLAGHSRAAGRGYLYQARFVQAAPGQLTALIEIYKAYANALAAAGEERPFWMRHSQGDKWDLMLLFPMSTYSEYYQPERTSKRERAESEFQDKLKAGIAWQEDLLVYGPPLEAVRQRFSGSGFFHVEIFIALAGKHAELYKQREMENRYLRNLKRDENLIFVRDQGASWDLFTIGFYRNLKHYAESSDTPPGQQESAAREAGFESAAQIGPYLRSLISSHHDTLAVAIK